MTTQGWGEGEILTVGTVSPLVSEGEGWVVLYDELP